MCLLCTFASTSIICTIYGSVMYMSARRSVWTLVANHASVAVCVCVRLQVSAVCSAIYGVQFCTNPIPICVRAAAADVYIYTGCDRSRSCGRNNRLRTASTCSPSAARGTHTFKITGYSLHRSLAVGKSLQSAPFDVGGYLWRITYFPDVVLLDERQNGDYAFVLLELVTEDAEARALVEFRLLDPANELPPSVVLPKKSSSSVFKHGPTLGTLLQPAAYLRDDSLVIECDITVLKESMVTAATLDIPVPPSDLTENFRELLEKEEEADILFHVKGEAFPAHKIVVAARSPVFKAELFGPMSDRTRRKVTVEDMQPAVFKALLHFIYTDSLPPVEENLEGDEGNEMVKHLLVAADRYAMERMKLMCESILCKGLDVENVTGTLALADQHHCTNLKEACLEYITSPDRMDPVMASQGYNHLKRSCPAVVIDVFERAKKSRRI